MPEGRRLFASLTVEENLLVGGPGPGQGPGTWRGIRAVPDARRAARPAGAQLSGGEQQAVAIGRALMGNPRLLLLDEVSLGLAPVVVNQLYAALPPITASGATVLVVEQDMRQAMAVADRVQCLLGGAPRSRARRTSADQVANAYFGMRAPMTLVNAVVQGVLLGGLYALFATGLSLMFGVMRIVNLAHGDFAVLGAFFAFVLVSASPSPFVTLLIVVPGMAAFGYLLQRGLLQRAVVASPLPPLLVTFGLSIVVQNLLLEFFSADQRRLGRHLRDRQPPDHRGLAIGYLPAGGVRVAVALLVGLSLFLRRTHLGRVMRATSDDQETARLMGVDSGTCTRSPRRSRSPRSRWPASSTASDQLQSGRRPDPAHLRVRGGDHRRARLAVGHPARRNRPRRGAERRCPDRAGAAVLAGHLVFLLVLALRPRGLVQAGPGMERP